MEAFLRAEGLIEFVTFGPTVCLTHAGRLRCEHGQGANTAAPSSGNAVNFFGDAIGVTIRQAGEGTQQSANVEMSGVDLARGWIEELRARLEDGTLAFPIEARTEVHEQVESILEELGSAAPRKGVLRTGIRAPSACTEDRPGDLLRGVATHGRGHMAVDVVRDDG